MVDIALPVDLKTIKKRNYTYEETEEGSGQGSVCSPIIANIYMQNDFIDGSLGTKEAEAIVPAVIEKI